MNKIFKPFIAILKIIYKIVDKLIVTPISKLVYRISKLGKNNGGRIEKILNRPIVLLYLSLALALLIFYKTNDQVFSYMENEAEILNNQKINVIYNSEKYVVEGLPKTVDITLIGSKSSLFLAKQIGDHKVVLDLTNYEPGTYKAKLKYNHSMSKINYKLDPSIVSFTISEKESKVFDLDYDLINVDKFNEQLNIENVSMEKNEIIIKGSKNTLDSIATVKALIDLEKVNISTKGEYDINNAQYSGSIRLVAYNKKGNRVKNIEMVPNNMGAKIKVESYSVELPVKVTTSGDITTGYAINSINSSISKVTVYGDQEVLDTLSYIEAPIDVTGLSTDKTFSGVKLTKPAGVRSMSATTTSVTVTLDSEATKEFDGIVIESRNLANGYTVAALSESDRTIKVIAKGVKSALDNLEASKIKAYIDLTGYNTSGTYEVEVKLETDDSRFTLLSASSKVNIKISKSS